MKQTQIMVEIVIKDDNTPAIIVRDPRGNIVKITSDPAEMSTFLSEIIVKLASTAPASN